jgi:DNA-binding Xre family transcriptional regulator
MVGNKIRQLIESQGQMPKTEVADKMGISATNLHLLMKKESVETKYLESLSKIFDVPVSYFFDEAQTKKVPSRESVKFGSDTVAFLMDQIREKDFQIRTLLEKVGKDEVLVAAGLSALFFCILHTDSLTPNGLGLVNC